MIENEMDDLGPIDYVVVEFPKDKADFSGEMAAHLTSLVEQGIVRVVDLLFVGKNDDGSIEGLEIDDFDDAQVGSLRELVSELGTVLAEEDVDHIAAALEPGTIAAALVWENTWAAPFASSIRRSGGQLVASGRIPVQAIIASLEADEGAAQTEGV